MTRKTVVIFGISSFVGSNLADFLKDDYRVIGTYHNTPVRIPGVLCIPCSVLAKKEVQFVSFAFNPDITIYAVGLSSVQECAAQDELAEALNYAGLCNVTENAQSFGSQVFYISTAFVFPGEQKKYTEIDTPAPNTVLGNTKFSAEFYLQKTSGDYSIFRCCHLYGRSYNHNRLTFFEMLQRKILLNETFQCDASTNLGFLDVYYLAMLVKLCIDRGVKDRIFQVSSTDKMTHYDFAKLYANVFQEPSEVISRGTWSYPYILSDLSVAGEGGAKSYDMDTINIENFLNINLPTIDESLKFTYKRFGGDDSKKGRSKQAGQGVTFI